MESPPFRQPDLKILFRQPDLKIPRLRERERERDRDKKREREREIEAKRARERERDADKLRHAQRDLEREREERKKKGVHIYIYIYFFFCFLHMEICTDSGIQRDKCQTMLLLLRAGWGSHVKQSGRKGLRLTMCNEEHATTPPQMTTIPDAGERGKVLLQSPARYTTLHSNLLAHTP